MSTVLTTSLIICVVAYFGQALVYRRPCKYVVKYVEEESNRWVADITIKHPGGLEGIWLNFTLSTKPHLLTNKFGPAVSKDNKVFVIERLDYILPAAEAHSIRVISRHNNFNVPEINRVILNGRSLCPNTIDDNENKCLSSVLPNGAPVPIVNVRQVCGTVTIEKDKIHSGTIAEEGHYPWQMALKQTTNGTTKYKCSAGLISQKFALTAAHCVAPFDGDMNMLNEYQLFAGAVNLNSKAKTAQIYQLSWIEVHPKYNDKLKNDIAILGLKTLAHITHYVRPICLPTVSMMQNDLYDKKGIVAGWGFTENGLVDNLTYANMPIISANKCALDAPQLYADFGGPTVFCVGARNGTSVCKGDSGAFIAVLNPDDMSEDRFYARGIVSLAKLIGECAPFDYAIFTDILMHMSWIKGIVDV